MSRVDRRGVRWSGLIVGIVASVAMLAVAAAAIAATGASVTTHQTKRGKALAAKSGHALYMFVHDKGTTSRCYGQCATAWPPFLTRGKPVAAKGSGVDPKMLGTTHRTNGKVQVTYNGHPLYLYKGDTKAGQISGEGTNQFGGRWYIIGTSGKAIKRSSGGGVCNPLCPGY